MKKRVISMILIAALAASAGACGKAETAPAPAAEPAQEEPAAPAEEPPVEELAAAEAETEAELSLPTSQMEVVSDIPLLVLRGKYHSEYDEEIETVLFNGEVEGVVLADECREKYPALAAALEDAWAGDLKVLDGSIEQSIADAREQYDQMADSGDAEFFREYMDQTKVQVTRCDDRVLSICSNNQSDYGGAHGMYGAVGRTYDVQNGELLALSDVIKDPDAFADLLIEKVGKDYPEVFEDLEDADVETVKETIRSDVKNDAETWILDPEGIVFFFNPYEIAPYAMGQQVVKVTASEAPDVFADYYLPDQAIDTVVEMTGSLDSFWIDVLQDGTLDCIQLSPIWDTYGEDDPESYMSGLEVVVNDGAHYSIVEDDQIFGYSAYTAYFADGNRYLLVWVSGLNDYESLYVLNMTDGSFDQKGEYWIYQEYLGYDEATEVGSSRITTDPNNLRLTEHFDRFSTFQAGGRYVLSSDGTLSPVDEYAVIPEANRQYLKLKSVKDLTLDIVDEEGNVVSAQETLPAGTEFVLYRTPYELTSPEFTDAYLSDGRIARLAYDADTEDGSRVINGMDEWEVFEELHYAG